MFRLAAFLIVGGGVMAGSQGPHDGVDLAALAALLTAISGLIATIGALWIANKRRSAPAPPTSPPSTPTEVEMLLELLLKERQDKEAQR